jgi:biotin-(acetyl-CoA carboxylase) ligase
MTNMFRFDLDSCLTASIQCHIKPIQEKGRGSKQNPWFSETQAARICESANIQMSHLG